MLVGSLPGADAEEAMTAALDAVGGSLTAITDGETGGRSRWLAHTIETLRDHPDLEVVKDGDQSDYDHMLNFRVRRGHRLSPDTLDLGIPSPNSPDPSARRNGSGEVTDK